MTRRVGLDASEKRGGIERDDRQPMMALLAARKRRSNLVILVTFRKGYHPEEAYKKGLKKSFTQKKEGLLKKAP